MLKRMPEFQGLTCFLAHGPQGGVSSSDPTDHSALAYILQLTLPARTDGYAHVFLWHFGFYAIQFIGTQFILCNKSMMLL